MSDILTEGNNIGDLLAYEQDKNYCREVLKSTDIFKMGQILAEKTADGTLSEVALTAETTPDGTEIARYVVLADSADGKVLVIARGAIVKKSGLVYPTGATDENKATIDKALKTAGILVREAI